MGADAADTPLARTLGLFASRFAGCIIVGATVARAPVVRDELPVVFVTDSFPDCGPLGGIHAALGVVTTPMAFVCGCDMPSLSGPLIDLMARRARRDRLLVPMHAGRPEPLHAFYPVSCLPDVERALNEGVRTMRDFFGRVPVDYLDEDEYTGIPMAVRSFDNINTPDDLDRLRS